MQVPGAATRDLLGLGSEKPGELPLEAQPRVLLHDALADRIGYLVAAEAEHVDGCAGIEEVGLGTGFEANVRLGIPVSWNIAARYSSSRSNVIP